ERELCSGHNNRSAGFAAAPLFFATGVVIALTFFPPRDAHASLIELTSRPGSGNTVYWNQLTGQNFTSTAGISGTVNPYEVVVQCCVGTVGNFNGDFAPGDYVITSYQDLWRYCLPPRRR